ncbi:MULTISPECIES: VOC family protein [Actinosynnema]|uniref:VOC family protein n=1 Tax=Actinosynnema TaxID=40566 RepID=UPI0020A2A940|nr:VOC family protein [Actinosynnema pretiosum]MCP2094788.1 Glyoxalase/Bleomycin resistance protein/Dioxygenase superfamily protein [Actinosynnema pretiosum]
MTQAPAPAATGQSRVPTIRNVDHLAYTVPDLGEAVDFFVDILGAEVLYHLGPVQEPDSDWMTVQLDVHPRASTRICLLRLGPVTNLELFQYTAPGQRLDRPADGDVGGHDLVLDVADLDAARAALGAFEPTGPVGGEGELRDVRSFTVRTPWGMTVVLRQVPERLPFESDGAPGLFRPAPDGAGSPGRVPGLLGVSQVGYTVADLDGSVDFFTDVIGGAVLHRTGRSALLRLGPVTNLELRAATTGRTDRPRNSDVGGHHLAFHTDDPEEAAAYLRTVPGVRVLGEVQLIDDGGPIHGDRWVYFTAPDGFQLEVLNMPPGMPYELGTEARRYGPAPEWRVG